METVSEPTLPLVFVPARRTEPPASPEPLALPAGLPPLGELQELRLYPDDDTLLPPSAAIIVIR